MMVQTGGSPYVLNGKFFKWKKLKAENMLSEKSERIKCEWSLEPSHQNATMQQLGEEACSVEK